MYVLENKGKSGKKRTHNILSFESFEFLMREKEKLEKLGNKCLVYKVENNGKEITRLTDKSEYVYVDSKDFDKEWRKGWKQYVNIRDRLMKNGITDFYVENDILYVKSGKNTLEIEMVRKTPRYEIRKNGQLYYDKVTSQNDIADLIFTKKGKIKGILGTEIWY